jgi:hypothetical protein
MERLAYLDLMPGKRSSRNVDMILAGAPVAD